jgi:hypothetical protein
MEAMIAPPLSERKRPPTSEAALISRASGIRDPYTTSQATAFGERIAPMTNFLFRCRQRLTALGFNPKSKLYQSVEDAYRATENLGS